MKSSKFSGPAQGCCCRPPLAPFIFARLTVPSRTPSAQQSSILFDLHLTLAPSVSLPLAWALPFPLPLALPLALPLRPGGLTAIEPLPFDLFSDPKRASMTPRMHSLITSGGNP